MTGALETQLFVTREKHLSRVHYPDDIGVQSGDLLLGLFGVNYPFVLRQVSKADAGDQPAYQMINIAYLADHKFGHSFLDGITPTSKWEDYESYGIREYRIV